MPIDDRLSSISSDLDPLSTGRAAALASVLHNLLVSLHFDVVNRELRRPEYGGDYEVRPFPLPSSPVDVATMKVRLRQGVKTSPTVDERRLARRIQYAFMFFVFGESLQIDPLEELFGDQWRWVDEALDLGLFVPGDGQTIRTNGLSLFSRRLRNGDVIHLFADTPPQFERRLAATPRVYIGADSYELMDRISTVTPASGTCCIEMGSGSGVQLVSALKYHPRLACAVGKESDRRAVNVSVFNAALNGVGERMVVVAAGEDLRAQLEGHGVAFAMTNPPFLAIPEQLDLESVDIPVDLHTVFPAVGWGGADGLVMTKQFINELQPFLHANTACIIYSQFAGDSHGPAQVRRYAETAGFQFRFEPLPSRRAFARDPATYRVLEGETQPVVTAAQAASTIARLVVAAVIAGRNPRRYQAAVRKGSPEHVLLAALQAALEKSYARQAITHFHDGFAILTRPEMRDTTHSFKL